MMQQPVDPQLSLKTLKMRNRWQQHAFYSQSEALGSVKRKSLVLLENSAKKQRERYHLLMEYQVMIGGEGFSRRKPQQLQLVRARATIHELVTTGSSMCSNQHLTSWG